jgi:flagellar assembly protein FliH
MTNPAKFTFDTHFDAGGPSKPDAPSARKNYTLAEIEVMRGESREEGKKDGEVRAAQAIAASTARVAAAIHTAIQAMDAEIETIRAESAALALAAARKLAGAALRTAPEAEIAEVLKAALHDAVGEPRIVVKTAPELSAAMEASVAALAAEQGFEGRIQFTPDAALSNADCRVEWRSGGIERAYKVIDDGLAELIARRFAGVDSSSAVKE